MSTRPLQSAVAAACCLGPALLWVLWLALQLGGCALQPPLIDVEPFGPAERSIDRVAVLPFHPKPGLARTTSVSGLSAWQAAALVTRFVSEAMVERGAVVIVPDRVETVLEGPCRLPSEVEPSVAAPAVADALGAGALLSGEVARYRERVGGDRGALASASVAFDLTLYEAPSGRKLWAARFDQTPSDFAANPLAASRYPGGGTRFLTAEELARRGAQLAAAAMPLAGGER